MNSIGFDVHKTSVFMVALNDRGKITHCREYPTTEKNVIKRADWPAKLAQYPHLHSHAIRLFRTIDRQEQIKKSVRAIWSKEQPYRNDHVSKPQ